MQYAELLGPGEAEQVHDASEELLESVGILVRSEIALGIFERHGCRVDNRSGIVKIPRAVVAQFRQAFVPTFTFKGRDPQFDKTIPDDSPVMVTASSAPDIIDPATGELRRATSTDIANIAFLVNELPGYDIFSTSTLANDALEGQFSLARFYPALKIFMPHFQRSPTCGPEGMRRVALKPAYCKWPTARWLTFTIFLPAAISD
jgi:trimethylamine--corrinoid protein Co-methyltransferase